jgi:inositol 1,4,5-triphosphate receptor type 3
LVCKFIKADTETSIKIKAVELGLSLLIGGNLKGQEEFHKIL